MMLNFSKPQDPTPVHSSRPSPNSAKDVLTKEKLSKILINLGVDQSSALNTLLATLANKLGLKPLPSGDLRQFTPNSNNSSAQSIVQDMILPQFLPDMASSRCYKDLQTDRPMKKAAHHLSRNFTSEQWPTMNGIPISVESLLKTPLHWLAGLKRIYLGNSSILQAINLFDEALRKYITGTTAKHMQTIQKALEDDPECRQQLGHLIEITARKQSFILFTLMIAKQPDNAKDN